MKKIILSALVLVALSSCASDKGDVQVPQKKKTEGQNATESCLPLNGKFVMKSPSEQGELTSTLELSSKVVDGKAYYQFSPDSEFLLADGEAKSIEKNGEKGTLKVTCSADAVEVESMPEGKTVSTAKYTIPAVNQVKVEATGDLVNLVGTYTIEESSAVVQCPVFNGKYLLNENAIFLSTKEESGVYSYAFDEAKTFYAANGKEQLSPDGKEKITMTCEKTTLTATTAKGSILLTAVAENQVKILASGEVAVQSGTYTRENN